jgi:hypothetical protein
MHPRYVWVLGVALLVGACGPPQAIEAYETAQEYEDECRSYVDQAISYFGIAPINELHLGDLTDTFTGGPARFSHLDGSFTVVGGDGQTGSGRCLWEPLVFSPRRPPPEYLYLGSITLQWDGHEMQCDNNWPEDTWRMMIDFRWTETPSLIAPSTTSSRLIFPDP